MVVFSFPKLQLEKMFTFIVYILCLSKCANSLKSNNFGIILGLIAFTLHIQVSLGDVAVIPNVNSSRSLSVPRDTAQTLNSRDPRILKDLSKLNRQGCLAKILCGIEVARPPSDGTSTMNDYAYLVKSFFDTFSFSGLSETFLDDADVPSATRERGDKPSNKKKTKKPSASALYKAQVLRDRLENEEIQRIRDGINGLTLEALLDDQDTFMEFRKRIASMEVRPRSKPEEYRNNPRIIRNPRFDKTMYLDRKQREYSMATDEAQKLSIAKEVGNKFRRGRQCRALFGTLKLCPWEATDLQNLLLNSSSSTTTTPRSTPTKPIKSIKPLKNIGSPYLYNDYSHLTYQDDEFPTAFDNPSAVLIETDHTYPQEGKGFSNYDPSTHSHAYSYPTKAKVVTTEKPKRKRLKEKEEEHDFDSSEEIKELLGSEENPEKSIENDREGRSSEEAAVSIENSELQNESIENDEASQHEYSETSDEDTVDSVERQDDEEDDYKSWSEKEDLKDLGRKRKNRKKSRIPNRKVKSKYSISHEALKFKPTDVNRDYMTVAQDFARATDRIISLERYLSGHASVWDPNYEKWKPYEKQDKSNQNENEKGARSKNENDKSKEDESSEEEEESSVERKEEEESSAERKEEEESSAEHKEENDHPQERRFPPPAPAIGFRISKFRGRRSADTNEKETFLHVNSNHKPLPPENLINNFPHQYVMM